MQPWRVLIAGLGVTFLVGAACGAGGGGEGGVQAGEVAFGVGRERLQTGDAQGGAGVVNQFGADLLARELGEGNGNVALSPWSVATALGMVRAGAAGATASEIDRVLHVDDPALFHQAMKALTQELASRNGTFQDYGEPRSVKVSAADRAYVQKGLGLEAGFLTELDRSYGASVGTVDYRTDPEAARREINDWVGRQTHGRIPELLGQDVLDALTRLVLVDAVYLNADWQIPFERGATSPAPFHTPGGDVRVPFMNGAGNGRVGDGWKSAVLPYAGNKLALTVVLPDPGNFEKVTGRLAAEGVGMFDAGQPFEINALSLPKFDIASTLNLGKSLSRLGIRNAFTEGADFSAMTREEQVALSHVLHQANITVDEKGTVAAAATGIVAGVTSAPARFERLVVNRPFLFFVRDLPTGAILFAGQVTDPSRKG
jgi:serpin B